jgi:hypothetical protein
LADIRKDVDAAFAVISAKYGINLDLGNIRFNENTFTGKITAAVITEEGTKALDPRHEANAQFYFATRWEGKRPDAIIGSEFITTNGKRGKIVDFDSKKSKYPVIFILNGDANRYKGPISHVREFVM